MTFKPGFRISAFDFVILVGGVVGSVILAEQIWWAGFIVGFVVLHFFLFCNVFRIPRVLELVWEVGHKEGTGENAESAPKS